MTADRLFSLNRRADFADFLDAPTLHYCVACQARFATTAGELLCGGCRAAHTHDPAPTRTRGYLTGALVA